MWSNFEITQNITNLASGNYHVTVNDLNMCAYLDSFTVSEPPALTVSIADQTDIMCNGASTGSATVGASGGTPPYIYIWSNGPSSATATNLAAGVYSVTTTDSNGCQAMIGVTITQPAVLTAAISTFTDETAGGACNGTAGVLATGGATPYTYAWSGGANPTNPSNSGLCAGVFNVTVTDLNGCSAETSVTISSQAGISVSISSSSDATCNGVCDGMAIATTSGGTAPVNYLWSEGQTTQTATNLCAGVYTVTATDALSMTATTNVTINEPALLTLTPMGTDATCGQNNGTASVAATGGTSPYTYTWSVAGSASTISNLAPGDYYVTVTDVNGCEGNVTVTVGSALAGTIAFTNTIDVSCFGLCNGQSTVQMTGGTSPFTYTWSTGETTPTSTSLCAGAGAVTVTDANACISVASVTITEPTPLTTIIASSTDETVSGACDGNAIATATGGTPGYTYAWTGGATTPNIASLCAGSYIVTVTDLNNCTASATATIATALTFTAVISASTNVTCFNGCDGTATASATGGMTPFTYSWSDGQTTQTATNLCAGQYIVTVTDALSNVATTGVTITQPVALTVTVASQSNVTCFGGNNGAININVTGGNGQYTFACTNGSTAEDPANFMAGAYTVTVTDINSCTNTDTYVTITEPPLLTTTVTAQTNVGCFGGTNGSATVTAGGGVSGYSYLWNDPAPAQTTPTATALAAGSYSVTVTDLNGCTQLTSVTITQPASAITATVSVTNVSCNGLSNGAINLTATGGTTPYTYLWSNTSVTEDLSNVAAGTYVVTITDSHSCTFTKNATVTQPAVLATSITSIINVSCNGGSNGSITVVAAGGATPYTFLWSSGASSGSATGLAAGTYTVTVTDSHGCTATESSFLTQPAPVAIAITSAHNAGCSGLNQGSATVSASGGTGPYTYLWNNTPPSVSATAINLGQGVYTVTATDSHSCTAVKNVTITTAPKARITGIASYSGGTISAGDAEVNLYKANIPGFNTVGTSVITSGGNFDLVNLPAGDFFLKVQLYNHANYTTVHNTFYDSTYQWYEATILTLQCGDTLELTVPMFEISPPASGNGNISGVITYHSNNKAINGEPVPGAEVTLEQEPDDEPVANSSTDSSGYYEFNNLGDATYSLYVDIPGLPHISTYTVNVNDADSSYSNLNFFIDTICPVPGIYNDSLLFVSKYEAPDYKIEVYPNPYKEQISVNYDLKKTGFVNIEVLSQTGQHVATLENSTQTTGNYYYTFSATKYGLKAGVYFIRMSFDNNIYIKKIVEIE